MAVETNTIMQANLARVRMVDFNLQFTGSLRKLIEALGVTRKIAVQEGAALKMLTVTGTLENGVVNEGDLIQVIVNTYDPANMFQNPAGDVAVTASFVWTLDCENFTTAPVPAVDRWNYRLNAPEGGTLTSIIAAAIGRRVEVMIPVGVEKRVDGRFGSDEGNLWKCVYGEGGMADLRSTDDWKFNWDQDNGVNYTYEFKGDEEDFPAAKAQLQDFILKLNGKGEESFYKWIKEVCDVEFLLKTYAVNVVTGMWDDHWNNGNNFYLYFNSTDKYDYQVFLLPYDYDNTLGTSLNCGNISDAGRHDPYDWGNAGILMERLMRFEDFRQMYKDALMELTDPANALFHMDASVPRIQAWQNLILPYVSNDTGEDMTIKDKPASWGNHHEYRLMDTGNDNFFRVKTETVSKMK